MKNSQNDEFTRHATAKPAPQAACEQAWHVLPVEAVEDRLQTDVARDDGCLDQ